MERQRAIRDPRTGRTAIVWIDLGPGRAVRGGGKPLRASRGQDIGPVRKLRAA